MRCARLVVALVASTSACGADDGGVTPGDTLVEADADADTVTTNEVEVDADVPTPCPSELEGQTRCADDGMLESCLDGAWRRDACPGALRCDGGACLPMVCTPDEATCVDADTRSRCNAVGTREIIEQCAGGCLGGQCQVTACELLGAKRGVVGCDYWAADLPNDESALDNVFAFAFSNASQAVARVTVSYPWGPVVALDVPVGGLATHPLPVPRTLSQIPGPGLGRYGFRIESDQPITAFMFNPLEKYDTASEATVATNDASILLPAPTLGREHLAVTWSDPGQFSRPPFVTIVATRDDTEVVVTPTTIVTMTQSPFVVPADEPTTFVLDRHETLNLEPPGIAGVRTDLTGTRVVSTNHPIAVFSGNRCARVPDAGRFCDHVETQLPALETWGEELVVTKFTDRGGEADYLRVVAREDGTTLTLDPPRAGLSTLDAGEHVEIPIHEDVVVRASAPVLVAQFMASQSTTTPPGPFGVSGSCPPEIGGTCQGDPALVLAPPVRQWVREHIFLVPDTYAHQFIAVAFAEGTSLTLDGVAVDTSAARTIGASAWRAITLTTSGGFRRLVASEPVAVVVYGFDHNISYAYNGGLELRDLRDE